MAKFTTGHKFDGIILMNKSTFDSIKHMDGQTYFDGDTDSNFKALKIENIQVKKRLKYIYLVRDEVEAMETIEPDAVVVPSVPESVPALPEKRVQKVFTI